MALAGATIKERQTLAGHTTADMAMSYQGISASHFDEVIGRVSQIMASG